MNALSGRNRRRSVQTLMLYGFVLLSVVFFLFVFLNMPASGPSTFGDLQNHFVSSNSRGRTKASVDRPARYRPRIAGSEPIPRSLERPWGLKDPVKMQPKEPEPQREPEPEPEQTEEIDREDEERLRREREEEEAREREEEEQLRKEREEEEREERERQEEEREEEELRKEREAEERQEEERRQGEEEQSEEERLRKEREEEERLQKELEVQAMLRKQVEEQEKEAKLEEERKAKLNSEELAAAKAAAAIAKRREMTERSIPKSTLRVALTSAYQGDRYVYMAKLTSETKRKYAEIHGYTYYEDNHLIPENAGWYERSAIRTKALIEHFDKYDWVYWSDVDIMITNPTVKLETFMKSGAHVILSRDWGDRQVNPGSILMKSSEFSRKFIREWEKAIREVTDDLRAFEKVMNDNPTWERTKVIYLPQQLINPYHHVETDRSNPGKLVKQPRPHPDGHHLWKEDSLLVHIINCLRTDRNDCQLLADYYYNIASETFTRLGFPLAPL